MGYLCGECVNVYNKKEKITVATVVEMKVKEERKEKTETGTQRI